MAPRRRLLFVTEVTPRPVDRGQRVRVKHLLAACRRSFEVTLIAPRPESAADAEAVRGDCDHVAWVDEAPHRQWRQQAALTATTTVRMMGLPRPRNVARWLPYMATLEQVDPGGFDMIWAERLNMAKLCAPYRRKTVLDLDDLDHVKIARRWKLEHSLQARAVGAYQFAYHRHLEVSWARGFYSAVVCSDEDREYLARRGCHNGLVVRNGASLPEVEPALRTRSSTTPLRLVFLGNVAFDPNADAIAYFVEHVLPLLRKVAPDATLDVVGPNADGRFRDRFGAEVRFRGFVDDLGAALAEYDVMVAPLRIGGGTKLKVLDAMAHRLPVVTTPVGAEGLGLHHGATACIARTPAEFVENIVRLKRDTALADRMTDAAHALAQERFSWPAIEERLARWLAEARP